jgi:hypothetical protein
MAIVGPAGSRRDRLAPDTSGRAALVTEVEKMSDQSAFDAQTGHKAFSAHCFNKTWDLIDKSERSAEEEEEMLRLSLTSLWHWTQRKDCEPTNLSVGYWQVSRVFALMGQADNARRFGRRSLQASAQAEADPFYAGYAHEALARAESVAGNTAEVKQHLEQARSLAQKIKDEESKKLLLKDLATI